MRGDGSEGPAMAPVPDGRPQDINIWLLADDGVTVEAQEHLSLPSGQFCFRETFIARGLGVAHLTFGQDLLCNTQHFHMPPDDGIPRSTCYTEGQCQSVITHY